MNVSDEEEINIPMNPGFVGNGLQIYQTGQLLFVFFLFCLCAWIVRLNSESIQGYLPERYVNNLEKGML